MARVLKQPCAGNCDGCEPANPCAAAITVGTGTCASRTGSGTIYGHCKFINPTSGDLNARRYRLRSLAGKYCRLNCVTPGWYSSRDFSLTYTIDDSGACAVGGYCVGKGLCEAGSGCYSDVDSASIGCGQGQNILFPSCTGYAETATTRVCTGNSSNYQIDVNYTDTLSEPDTVDAAIQRNGGGTAGTECRTGYTSSTSGSCTNGYEGSTSVSATSVVVSIPLSGMSAGCSYTVSIELDRYTHAGAFVDTVNESVTFTAASESDTLTYHVPITSEHAYEYVGASQSA